jgi:hypothetical protein
LILYQESSAVLAWLLGEARAPDIRDRLSSAEVVIASEASVGAGRAGVQGTWEGAKLS